MRQCTCVLLATLFFAVFLRPLAAKASRDCGPSLRRIKKIYQQRHKLRAWREILQLVGSCQDLDALKEVRRVLIRWSIALQRLDVTVNKLEMKMRRHREKRDCSIQETNLRWAQKAYQRYLVCRVKGCRVKSDPGFVPLHFCPGFKSMFRRIVVKRRPRRGFRCSRSKGFRAIRVFLRRPRRGRRRINQWRSRIQRQHSLLKSRIQFRYNKAVVDPKQMALLQAMSGSLHTLLKQKDRCIWVVGHTDSDGGYNHNLRLSRARAKSVVRVLAQMGLSRRYFRFSGASSTQPIATNRTSEGKAKNRRVEFIIMK